jgi:hypothetical protein
MSRDHDNHYIKQIKINYKVQFLINSTLKNEIEKNNNSKMTKKTSRNQLELTCQIHDPSHEIKITP